MKTIILSSVLCFLMSAFVFAGNVYFPVHDTFLSYNASKGLLHVKAVHPSNNFAIDYVRRMTVSVNGRQVLSQNYSHQMSGDGFSDDVSVSAKEGDVISVQLFATGGNSDTASLTVGEAAPSHASGDNTGNNGSTAVVGNESG